MVYVLLHDQGLKRTDLVGAGEKLLASQQDFAAQSALIRAMNELLTTNGIENTTDRTNKRRFRVNLTKFVVAARSIIRLR